MIPRPIFDCIFDYWSEEDKSFRKIDLSETKLTYKVPYRSFIFELYEIETLLENGFIDTFNTEIKDKEGFEYFIYALPISEGCYNQVKNYLDLILSVNPDDQDLAYYLFEHLQENATNSPQPT